MYAVIKTGGKQYRVQEGTTLQIEKIDAAENSEIEFSEVLLIANGENVTIGAPLISGAKVIASVVKQGRGEKIKIVKFRRRKHYRNITGHRQYLTTIKITGIQG